MRMVEVALRLGVLLCCFRSGSLALSSLVMAFLIRQLQVLLRAIHFGGRALAKSALEWRPLPFCSSSRADFEGACKLRNSLSFILDARATLGNAALRVIFAAFDAFCFSSLRLHCDLVGALPWELPLICQLLELLRPPLLVSLHHCACSLL